MSTSHPHIGHRERLKQRYIKFGANALEDHELLELLLFFSKPRVDTNVVAHDLIRNSGSFEKVFTAKADSLKMTDGIGEHSALLLNLVGDVHRRLTESRPHEGKSYNTLSSVGELLMSHGTDEREEKLTVMLFDQNMKLLHFETVSKGDHHSAAASYTEIAKTALLKGAVGVIIAHNHPSGDPMPSSSDRNFTHLLEAALYAINISLIEHIIVSGNAYFPTMMTSSGPGRLSLINGLLGEGFLRKFYGN
jgi:DNA repair protein RadC